MAIRRRRLQKASPQRAKRLSRLHTQAAREAASGASKRCPYCRHVPEEKSSECPACGLLNPSLRITGPGQVTITLESEQVAGPPLRMEVSLDLFRLREGIRLDEVHGYLGDVLRQAARQLRLVPPMCHGLPRTDWPAAVRQARDKAFALVEADAGVAMPEGSTHQVLDEFVPED